MVVQTFGEPAPGFRVDVVRQVFFQRLAHEGDEVLTGQVLAGRSDDAAVRAELAVDLPVEQGRQQLAPREVAGAAENDQVEGLYGSELGHGGSLLRVFLGDHSMMAGLSWVNDGAPRLPNDSLTQSGVPP